VTPPSHLPEKVAAVWSEIVATHGPRAAKLVGPEFDAYCATVARHRDAVRRIAEEGAIVPDSKNAPMPHPAIEIEKSTLSEIRRWGSRYLAKSNGR